MRGFSGVPETCAKAETEPILILGVLILYALAIASPGTFCATILKFSRVCCPGFSASFMLPLPVTFPPTVGVAWILLKVIVEAAVARVKLLLALLKLTLSIRTGLILATLPVSTGCSIAPVSFTSERKTPVTGTGNCNFSVSLAAATVTALARAERL